MSMDFSDTVDSFQRSAVPRWLVDYVRSHYQLIVAQLRANGTVSIPSPDRGVIITIKRTRP